DLLGSSPEGSNGCRETHPRTQWPLALAKALTMRQTIRNSQNEPGMCPGINRLTFWCGPQTRSPRLAHIAKSTMYAPPEAGFGCASAPNRWETKPECVLESIVSQSARLSRIGA